MGGLVLIARIAGEPAAVPAAAVGSVVEIDRITPVPRVAPHVAGLFALRSHVLTVIDASAALGLGVVARGERMTALAIQHDGHSYALLVDAVDDVVEVRPAEPCPATLAPAWARVATGMVLHEERPVLLVDPVAFIADPLAAAA